MKKVLVIGGSYFAGRVFVEELRREKEVEIHVFNRGRLRLGLDGVIEHRGDREEPEQIRGALPAEDWDAVVDFCGYTPAHIETMLACLPGKIRHYLFVSTTSVCRNGHDLPLRENAPKLSGPQPELGPMADYGYDKWLAECALRRTCGREGIAWTVLRPAIIYGYYNYAPRESYFFDLLRKGLPVVIPESGLALFSFIWVVDMAQLIIRCIGDERAHNQDFNLSSDELVSYPRIVEVLEEISGKRIEVIRKPAQEITRERIPMPFPPDEHLIYSGARLQRIFNFDYTPFATGMRKAHGYYQMVKAKQESPSN